MSSCMLPPPSLQALWMPPPPGVELSTWRRLARIQAANLRGPLRESLPLHGGLGEQRMPAASRLATYAPNFSPWYAANAGPSVADPFSAADGDSDDTSDASDAGNEMTGIKTT